MIKKDFLNKTKEKLEKEKEILENELKNFSKKDKESADNWNTSFPEWNKGEEAGSSFLETSADEFEEYDALISVEHILEAKLRDINSALKKLKQGKYGICEKCQKEISQQRLRICPDARLCLKCRNGNKNRNKKKS